MLCWYPSFYPMGAPDPTISLALISHLSGIALEVTVDCGDSRLHGDIIPKTVSG